MSAPRRSIHAGDARRSRESVFKKTMKIVFKKEDKHMYKNKTDLESLSASGEAMILARAYAASTGFSPIGICRWDGSPFALLLSSQQTYLQWIS